jgi:hypothetical protein
MYSCHHNSSGFTFRLFVHLLRFSVFRSVVSATLRLYYPKTPIHLLNLKFKHEFSSLISEACGLASSAARDGCCKRAVVAEPVNTQ